MSKEFKIGNPVQVQKYYSMYKLVVENMSGDADSYETTETLFNTSDEPLISEIFDLCKWAQKDWPSRESISERMNEISERYDGAELCEIITYDSWCDCVARPAFQRLTWYDCDGIEREVIIKEKV